jgi:hypothetical protein
VKWRDEEASFPRRDTRAYVDLVRRTRRRLRSAELLDKPVEDVTPEEAKMTEPDPTFDAGIQRALDKYLRERLKPPHKHPLVDTRWLAAIAAIAGGYVVFSEVTYRGAPSTLTPILFAVGVAIVALAAAHFLKHKDINM